MESTKKTWDKWELIAIKYLQWKGYNILDTNYKFSRYWEIDIICFKNNLTCFIEVKYRSSNKYWTPEESINKSKIKKLEKTIHSYCLKNKIDIDMIRFDVIAINKWVKSYKLTHYKSLEL